MNINPLPMLTHSPGRTAENATNVCTEFKNQINHHHEQLENEKSSLRQADCQDWGGSDVGIKI